MNPMTNIKNITKLNEIELSKGFVDKKSWHDMYKESAWIFIGGLSYDLTEGDILSVFSQYGEIVNINMVRDKKTGKTKGFCFLCYANQKSTVLAVDNLNGIKLTGRTIRVDHVANYKPPKDHETDDDITRQLKAEGCAPKPTKQEVLDEPSAVCEIVKKVKKKKIKKEKKKCKKRKSKDNEKLNPDKKIKIKEEKHDPGYSKYESLQTSAGPSSRKDKRTDSLVDDVSADESSSSDSSPDRQRESKNSNGNSDQLRDDRRRHDKDSKIHKRKHASKRHSDSSGDDAYIDKLQKRQQGNGSDRHKHSRKHRSSSGESSGSDDRKVKKRCSDNRNRDTAESSSSHKRRMNVEDERQEHDHPRNSHRDLVHRSKDTHMKHNERHLARDQSEGYSRDGDDDRYSESGKKKGYKGDESKRDRRDYYNR